MPSPNISDFVYAALLYTGESHANPLPESFVKGEPNESGDKLAFSFQRPDETDGLTLEVFAFKDGTTTFSKDNALLSGKKTGLKVNSDKIEVVETIALEVNKSSTEKGTVSLKITVPDGCSLEIDDTAMANFTITSTAPNFTITQNGTDIPAGKHSVTFTVKKGEEIIHIFPESINVLPGMHTNTWGGLAKDEAKVITQSMISSTVYVRGGDEEGQCWYAKNGYANIEGKDSNSGSYLAPLATIQKAVDTVIARNDGMSKYTICIDGTLKYDENTYISTRGSMADFAKLDQDLNLTIKALSGTATLDGGARFDADGNVEDGKEGIKNCIIFAHPTSGVLKLSLENLVITGANCSFKLGGGIYFRSPGGEFTISGGTKISGNMAHSGGGVYVYSGTFTMNGGTISDCTATNQGGGMYINSAGTFNMSETAKITGSKTTSTDTGTGGGGIYNAGTLTITGGIISECSSAKNGGAIYNSDGTLTVTDGTVSNCTAEQGNGGGIYLDKGSVTEVPQSTITGMTISECTARYGGGVYVNSGISFRMNDTTISDCTASGSGGGVINSSGDAKITNCIIKLCKAGVNGYGGGGIYNSDGTLTVTGGEISGNYAKSCGGGIYNLLSSSSQTCSITLTNVKIFKNKADSCGGGMYNRRFISGTMSLMTLNGGTVVSENDAPYGGGVYDLGGGLTLNGATVSQNTATNVGSDVYAEYRGYNLYFSGTTFVGDLYLDRKSDGDYVPRQITVHPDLTCASGKTVCATITLPYDQYVSGTKILQTAGGGTMAQVVCDKFALLEGGWVVAPDGEYGVLQAK